MVNKKSNRDKVAKVTCYVVIQLVFLGQVPVFDCDQPQNSKKAKNLLKLILDKSLDFGEHWVLWKIETFFAVKKV
jgi:hypothetical protein